MNIRKFETSNIYLYALKKKTNQRDNTRILFKYKIKKIVQSIKLG